MRTHFTAGYALRFGALSLEGSTCPLVNDRHIKSFITYKSVLAFSSFANYYLMVDVKYDPYPPPLLLTLNREKCSIFQDASCPKWHDLRYLRRIFEKANRFRPKRSTHDDPAYSSKSPYLPRR